MKKLFIIAILIIALVAIQALAQKGQMKKSGAVTIQEEILLYAEGHYLEFKPLEVGFDDFGYNYQAMRSEENYFNAYAGRDGYAPYKPNKDPFYDDVYLSENPGAENHWAWGYRDVRVKMNWNIYWLSNMDSDFDGKLDRFAGSDSYIDSGAWLTNHQWGEAEGYPQGWFVFTKISAAKSSWVKVDGFWFDKFGNEMGEVIWGSFAVVQENNINPEDKHRIKYLSPKAAGLGKFGPRGNWK